MPNPGAPIEMIGGFETTYQPSHDRDVAETTGHDRRWRADVALLRASGVRTLRYPVRWHRVEERVGRLDWRETDEVMEHLLGAGLLPIVDLVHHTSYPRWLDDGFADPRFGPAYLRYAEAFARRYPEVTSYTLFNEPFSTLFLAGHEGIWPPHLTGVEGFMRLLGNVLPAVTEASCLYRELLPGARHVWVDTCENHTAAANPAARAFARMANDRRFFVLDRFLGRPPAGNDAFVPEALAAGAAPLLEMAPGTVDVLGLDYYAHCQWHFTGHAEGVMPTPEPLSLADQIELYWRRYGLPCMLTETNLRGFASDRASWFKHTLEQCEVARDRGVPIEGYCWFPFLDSADWASLLCLCEGAIDPVGVYWLDPDLERRPSSMSVSWSLAASGTPAAELPAYRLQPPVDRWLRGWLPFMDHWHWREPPAREICSNETPDDAEFELRRPDADAESAA